MALGLYKQREESTGSQGQGPTRPGLPLLSLGHLPGLRAASRLCSDTDSLKEGEHNQRGGWELGCLDNSATGLE